MENSNLELRHTIDNLPVSEFQTTPTLPETKLGEPSQIAQKQIETTGKSFKEKVSEKMGLTGTKFESDLRKSPILQKGLIGKILQLYTKIVLGKEDYKQQYKDLKGKIKEQTLRELEQVNNEDLTVGEDSPVIGAREAIKKGLLYTGENETEEAKSGSSGKSPISTNPFTKTTIEGLKIAQLPIEVGAYKEKIDKGKNLSKQEVALGHKAQGSFEKDLKPLQSSDGKVWTGLKLNKETGEMIPGGICPTSDRVLDTSDDLNNVYFHIDQKGHITFSCGVINTPEKANQFIAAVKYAVAQRKEQRLPESPLRIGMHQLNAMLVESGLIGAEEGLVDDIDEKLCEAFGVEGPVVSYDNNCINGCTNVLGEKQKSQNLNLKGLAVKAGFVNEDLNKDLLNILPQVKILPTSKVKLGEKIQQRDECQEKVTEDLNKIRETKKQLSQLQNEMKSEKEQMEEAKLKDEISLMKQFISDSGEDYNDTEAQLRKAEEELEILQGALKEMEKERVGTTAKGSLRVQLQNEKIIKQNFNIIELQSKKKMIDEIAKNKKSQIESHRDKLKEIKNKNIDNKAKIEEYLDLIATTERSLKGNLKELARANNEVIKESKNLLQKTSPSNEKEITSLNSLISKLEVNTQILASQLNMEKELGFPKLSPAEEIGVNMVFDLMLGIITQMNCKSGLDRTGFVRALTMAIKQKYNEGMDPIKLLDFIRNFENNVKKLDKRLLEGEKNDKYLDESGKFSFEKWIKDNDDLKDISNFQSTIFGELMGVAMPITGRSCGVAGLKWHHDKHFKLWNPGTWNPLEKNMHPLPYLPRYMMAPAGKDTKWVRLLENPSKLTQEGTNILMLLSKKRGS